MSDSAFEEEASTTEPKPIETEPIAPQAAQRNSGDPAGITETDARLEDRDGTGAILADLPAGDVVLAYEHLRSDLDPSVAASISSSISQPGYAQSYIALASEPPIFSTPVEVSRPPRRIPNILDAFVFLLMLIAGLIVTVCVLGLSLYLHWFGLTTLEAAQTDARIALGTQFLMYLVAFLVAFPVYPLIWHKSFFTGLHWHAATARRFALRLIGAAFLCNILAGVGSKWLPSPDHAPIEKLFNSTANAWLIAVFGITIAPFFEEMIYRGFLLPALATAWDWCGERISGKSPRPLDSEGNPVWSPPAMIVASLFVSVPFALMHAPQLANAWGPLALLYAVSLVLCAVRLVTRSLASSTFVHATYNFVLFAIMFAETSGFRHMEKAQ